MENRFDALLFGDDLSPEDRSSIQERLDDDPDLATAWAHWRAVRRRVRENLEETLPDRRLLVLYVLDQEGTDDPLSARERDVLEASRDEIARAIDAIPALEQVVERIREERADFEQVWATHIEEEGPLSRTDSLDAPSVRENGTGRPDRATRSPRSPETSTSSRWSRRLAVAFSVAALAAVGVLLWPGAPSTTTVTVADGEEQVETLADGSTVRLVGPATLSYPAETEQTRKVSLEEGRAFFDVQPREETSFVVETPTARATVLGTQFGVATRADTTSVVLATGSVQVERPDGPTDERVVLKPGQRSWVADGNAPAAPTPVDLTDALNWTGLFVFRSTPLTAITERLQRRYDTQISVASSLADRTVTGTFDRDQSLQEVLQTLAATLGAEVRQESDDQYRLVPAQ